ncbi:hypothetical protein BDV12DRAFT_201686 [Aspergillus spectabilis]
MPSSAGQMRRAETNLRTLQDSQRGMRRIRTKTPRRASSQEAQSFCTTPGIRIHTPKSERSFGLSLRWPVFDRAAEYFVQDVVDPVSAAAFAFLEGIVFEALWETEGVDTKVLAVQAYTRALQGLSENLDEAEKSMRLLAGVLVHFAYFECFNGNVPAAFRCPNEASSTRPSENELPPRLLSDIPKEECLLLALYTFYKARLVWAFSFVEGHNRRAELESYYCLYHHIQIVASFLENHLTTPKDGQLLTCERLKVGFAPMLYALGHCCPNPTWLRWIISALEEFSHHGLFNSDAYATSLHVLLKLQKSDPVTTESQTVECYPHPSRRVTSALYPQLGKGFTAYYTG